MVKFLLGGGVDESSVILRNASEDVDAAATAAGCCLLTLPLMLHQNSVILRPTGCICRAYC